MNLIQRLIALAIDFFEKVIAALRDFLSSVEPEEPEPEEPEPEEPEPEEPTPDPEEPEPEEPEPEEPEPEEPEPEEPEPEEPTVPAQPRACNFDLPGEMPDTVDAPVIPNINNEYVFEPKRWDVNNTGGGDQIENGKRISQAIAWAKSEGYGTFKFPPGEYLVGEQQTFNYSEGVSLLGGMCYELADSATIKMGVVSTFNSSAVAANGQNDIIIRGGHIYGNKEAHIETGDSEWPDDEGYCLAIWGGKPCHRVLIEDIELSNAAGDGLMIGGGDGNTTNVIVRRVHTHHNRRQGISIVGGQDIVIEDCDIHDQRGSMQEYGIDIESPWWRLPHLDDRNILIQRNRIYNNGQGAFVDMSGDNVWFLNNECDGHVLLHTGHSKPNSNGRVIRNNIVRALNDNPTNATLMNYHYGLDLDKAQIIEHNQFLGGTVYGSNKTVAGDWRFVNNVVTGGRFMFSDIRCLELKDNVVDNPVNLIRPFMFTGTRGVESGNTFRGQPFNFGITPDKDWIEP